MSVDTTALLERKKLLSALAQNLQDRPIEQGDRRYFPFHQAPGEPRGRDPIRELRSAIEMMNAQGTCQLFSGFRGSGKSTELRRLQAELEQQQLNVLFVQGATYINMTKPLETGDLLLSVSIAVAEQLYARTERSPERESILRRITSFLNDTKVEIKDVELNTGFARLKAQLSRDSTFKARVQAQLRDRLTDFVRQCADFMQEARKILAPVEGGPCPVLIVDDLEKIRGSLAEADLVQRSIEEIFSQFTWALRFPGWHTVWTVPPYLQLLSPGYQSEYDGCTVLPMIRIWRDDPGRTPDPEGLAAMLGCLRLRGDVDSLVTSPALLERVVHTSAGHLRDLVRLVRELAVDAHSDLQAGRLDERGVARVLDDYVQQYQQVVYDEDLDWLRKIAAERKLSVPDAAMVKRAAKLLDSAIVMTYRNGRQWFDVHGAILKKL